MSNRIADTHAEFFEKVGSHYLHPKTWGETLFPMTVEEMYQHFKARLLDEMRADSASPAQEST